MSQLPSYDPTQTGATSADVAAAITDTAAPAADLAPGIPPIGRQYGVVGSIQPGNPPTLTLTLAGSTSPIPGVRYVIGYSPNVNDTVIVDHVGTDVIVSGALASSATSGGPVPVGMMGCFPAALSDAAWLLCNGASFSGSTYPALYSFLGGTTLPDMRDTLPMGAHTLVSLGNTAGSATTSGLLAHTHASAAHTHSHSHAGPSHTHTGASHTHSHNHAGLTHSHGHSHNDSVSRSYFYSSLNSAAAGSGALTPNSSGTITTDTDATTASPTTDTDATAGGTGATGASGTGQTDVDATSTTPGATGSTGSSGSYSVLNPVTGVDWFIRAL